MRFLNSVGGGVIRRIEGNMAYVDYDGFETPTLLKECVVVLEAKSQEKAKTEQNMGGATVSQQAPKVDIPVYETERGDMLNAVLTFEPKDINRLETTSFDSYFINDSNYFLQFSFLSKKKGDRDWTLRFNGIVEPNIEIHVETLTHSQLREMDMIMVQFLAYKRGKSFEIKTPVQFKSTLGAERFLQSSNFAKNVYSDQRVMMVEVAKNDFPCKELIINVADLEKGMREKKLADSTRRRAIVRKDSGRGETIVTDLHIEELLETTAGMSNADILGCQIEEFRKVMDANLKHRGQKLVFIHGKGEGVLRQAVLKELKHRYKGHDVQDASFREYGFGATQVTIK